MTNQNSCVWPHHSTKTRKQVRAGEDWGVFLLCRSGPTKGKDWLITKPFRFNQRKQPLSLARCLLIRRFQLAQGDCWCHCKGGGGGVGAHGSLCPTFTSILLTREVDYYSVSDYNSRLGMSLASVILTKGCGGSPARAFASPVATVMHSVGPPQASWRWRGTMTSPTGMPRSLTSPI